MRNLMEKEEKVCHSMLLSSKSNMLGKGGGYPIVSGVAPNACLNDAEAT